MQESTYLAALAGLLHDIGKFAVRAGQGGSRVWDAEAARDFGYKHALLTADFIDGYVPEPWRVDVKNASGNHHRPLQRLDTIISLADHLSAGERADVTADERASQPRQLLSIFCSLEAREGPKSVPAYWPLAPLSLSEEVLFPGEPLPEAEVWRAYERLWNDFLQDAVALAEAQSSEPDLLTYVEALQLLLQRYAWSIPSAYFRNRPDISLYDHLRTTAALAAILEGSDLTDAQLGRLRQEPRTEAVLAVLVGGDISGVQDFIYTISSRGATSSLRGRSFYLQLLTEAVARYVLRRLGLPITNLIYAGGGHYYLLARPGDVDELRVAQTDISRLLLQHHKGDLYVAIASQPLRGRDFFDGHISSAWASVSDGLRKAKQRRFVELGGDLWMLFRAQGHGGNEEGQCQVCGAEHLQTAVQHKEAGDEGVRKCPACVSYEELGAQLRRAGCLVLTETEPRAPDAAADAGSWEDVLAGLGVQAALFDTPARLAPDSTMRRLVLALSDQAARELRPGRRTAAGRRFLVNVTPTIYPEEIEDLRRKNVPDLPDREGIKPFGALEAQSMGIKRLGVMRMDVDNLGRLFSEGLGQEASLSRVSALSFTLSLFFEGWVEHLAIERNRSDTRGERLYSIYSGGDDLFFVGAWDAVVELGRDIRIDLGRFAAGHPDVHASAGIALVGGKYPLYQAAQDAQRAEEQAKSLRWEAEGHKREKDAVSFLGQALPWRQFGLEACADAGITSAHALMHLLHDMSNGQGEAGAAAPRALVRRLIGLYEQYAEASRVRQEAGTDVNRSGQPQVLWGPWMWRAQYYLSRMAKQTRNDAIKDLRDKLKADDFRSMERIGLAARWAELLTR